MLKGFITNLGKYNEGELMGKWVDFPVYDVEQVFEEIGIDGRDYEEYFFTDYDCDYDFPLELGEYESIETLNKYAEALEGEDGEVISAYLEAVGGSLFEAFGHIDDCIFFAGMSLEDVAYELVQECYVLPEIAKRYFDYESFARDLSFDGYIEVSGGVICIG